jgi:hypothetical protein
MARDPAFEAIWRRQLARRVQRDYGLSTVLFDGTVVDRLAFGEEQFGDQFMRRDNAAEGIEEAADIGVYAILETQRRMAIGMGGQEELMAAAVHGALADHFFRLAVTVEH